MKNNHHKVYILLFLIVIFSFNLGFAYLNSSLFINGTSIVSANVWEVGLDNLNIASGSVAAIKEPVTNNEIVSTSFEVKLENKEDFYEFTVDVVNRGEHDAKLGSLIETTGLTQEQEQYFEYTVTYQNNEPIQVNQLVKKDEFVRLKSKVEYKEDVEITQVPESAKTLKLDIKMNYDLDDGTGIAVKNNGVKITPIANGSLDDIGTIVTIGTEKFYTIGIDGDNVKLLSMYNLYVGNMCTANFFSCTPYGNEATGMQNENMKGFIEGVTERNGTTQFSDNSAFYTGSLIEGFVNNYRQLLEENFLINIIEARLILKDELINEKIGCSIDNKNCYNAPDFIYLTSYWTGTSSDGLEILNVESDGAFSKSIYSYDTIGRFGVRPVIFISKNDISKETFNFTIDDVTYQAEVGMTWDEWIDSKYNVEKFTLTYNDFCYSGLGEYYGFGAIASQLSSGSLIDNSKIYSFNYKLEPPLRDTVGICIKK